MRRALAGAGKLLLPGLLAAAVVGGGATVASASLPPVNGAPRVAMILVDTHFPDPATVLEEHQAVLNYATALPADVRTGMIIFSDSAQYVVRPTTNRSLLNQVLASSAMYWRQTSGTPTR